jgi:metal-sulfur cluster biosynthetic enzyme
MIRRDSCTGEDASSVNLTDLGQVRTANWAAAVACIVVLAPTVSACTGQSEVCDDVQALRTSVENLQDATVGENALDVIVTEVRNIEEALGMLAEDASDEYATEIGAVREDVDQVKSSTNAAIKSPTRDSLRQVGNDLRTVRMSVDNLVTSAGDTC